MISVEKILFPGIAAGCLFLVLVTSLISKPAEIARASVLEPPEAAAVNVIAQALPIVPVVNAEVVAAEKTKERAEQPVQEQSPAGELVSEEAAEEAPVPTAQVIEVDIPAEPAQEAPSEEEIQSGGSAPCDVSQSYPDSIQQWCGPITAAAQQHEVDPNLIAAVMLQESGGNADAYSKSGAVGLMQVMPRDGLAAGFMCINGPCFSARPSMDELFDPEFNIAYGVRMLAGLIQKHGSEREALRAYGPMNMGYYYADLVLGIYNRNQ